MKEQVKIITFISGHGETVAQPPTEGHINEWLAQTRGTLVRVTQSESERVGGGHHVTLCLWYVPEATTAS